MIHVDEEAENIDWNIAADVVGITFHTPSAFHAYDIAARFRSRGICVVMGGPHVTLLPEEASQHADVVFIGEAEGLWEDFLRSFESGTDPRVYRQTSAPSMENAPTARKDLFHRRDHCSGVLFATRGCPGQCDFCTVAVMYRHKLGRRPHGIAVQAGIVFGFDHDTPKIFEDTIDFLERAGVQNATFNILTPFPGTPLFRRM